MLGVSIHDLSLTSDLVQNATQRATRITELKTSSLTDYAWHFNTGQKLDMLQEDINEIKNELGLVENFTYVGPNR